MAPPATQPTVAMPSQSMGPPLGRPASKPGAPPKPKTLMTGSSGVYQARPSSSSSSQAQSQSPAQPQPQVYQGTGRGPSLAALLARDNEGVAAPGPGTEERVAAEQETTDYNNYSSQAEDWEADFSKRFPSLSGIEMVETEISAPSGSADLPQRRGLRIKEV